MRGDVFDDGFIIHRRSNLPSHPASVRKQILSDQLHLHDRPVFEPYEPDIRREMEVAKTWAKWVCRFDQDSRTTSRNAVASCRRFARVAGLPIPRRRVVHLVLSERFDNAATERGGTVYLKLRLRQVGASS